MRREARTSTIASDVYAQIRTDIITAALPPGSKLKIERLREKYDVGISPVREALNRLSAEGLVVVEDLKGFNVPEVSLDGFRELARTARLTNAIALEEAMERGGAEWEKSVILELFYLKRTPVCDVADPRRFATEWEVRHRSFHSTLIAGCQSRYLIRFCDILLDMSDRYRHLYLASGGGAGELVRNHEIIVDAILARDSRSLRHHLEAFSRDLEEFFVSAGVLKA